MKSWTKRAAVGSFFVALWIPSILGVLEADPATSNAERRKLAPLPSRPGLADVAQFPEAFERYYDDHIGLRRSLIEWNARVRTRGLGVSPSNSILVGHDGWLYLGDRNGEQLTGRRSFSLLQLRQWALLLDERRRWLEAEGIVYLVVLAPLKGVVYPEYLPRTLLRERSTFEELGAFLSQKTELDVLRLDQVLRAARHEDRLFHRTDPHWNDAGAYVAYRAILERLAARVPTLAQDTPVRVRRRTETSDGLDLASLWGLAAAFPEEQIVLEVMGARTEADTLQAGVLAAARKGERDLVVGSGDPDDPVAIVFRDSFGSALVPFLSEHFSELTFVWNRDIDPDRIRRTRPAVVIHEIWEGTVGGMRWGPPQHPQWRTPSRPDGV